MKCLITGLLLLILALNVQPVQASESMVIDSFDYADETDARNTWRPVQNSPPVSLVARDGGKRSN